MRYYTIFILVYWLNIASTWGWGFAAHKHINRQAVFTLPPPLFSFYKYYLAYITEYAINPDKRRYSLVDEAAKHYIDLDYYEDTTFALTAQHWKQATILHEKDILLAHGILPWHIVAIKNALTNAWVQKDWINILKLSTDLGHYLADANVPLHTTQNYNGQLTDQEGIHALWETRIPMLFMNDYDLFTGPASYIVDSQRRTWEAILQAHAEVANVLNLEKQLTSSFPSMHKYGFEQQGDSLKKDYSKAYVEAYHKLLGGQVERQMKAAIKLIGDFWLTCWIDAGKPDWNESLPVPLDEQQLQETTEVVQPIQPAIKPRVCGEE